MLGRNQNISWGFSIPAGLDTEDLYVDHNGSFDRTDDIFNEQQLQLSRDMSNLCSNANRSDIDTGYSNVSSSNYDNTYTNCSSNTSNSEGCYYCKIDSTTMNSSGSGIVTREEIIRVRNEEEPVIYTVQDTINYGPIISDILTPLIQGQIAGAAKAAQINWHNLALSSQALRLPMNMLHFLHSINKAQSFFGGSSSTNNNAEAVSSDSFLAAANGLQALSLNIVYADKKGNIGHVVTGRYVCQ